jgi:DNA-binding transcriptional MerR regulator
VPPAGRSAGGYRLYAEPDLHRLQFIRQAKALGLTLDAIHEVLAAVRTPAGDGPRARLRKVLGERLVHVTRQIDALTELRDDLQRRQRRLARRNMRRHGRTDACTCLSENRRR